ncbi:hypothetical protein VHEMI05928 [[Torrubiella] hemipterigena]|uniref:UBZ4-type domain-containing protein n=1 Tax=[Torrubiella] hemipterigena TaxID=1531966 RepID=A0A0A1T5P0_9HYPO|nr:hypothetical protein VHEMI05928 [[Torrubiella] hemipterigena]
MRWRLVTRRTIPHLFSSFLRTRSIYRATSTAMNRPRNKQPRPNRDGDGGNSGSRGGHRGGYRGGRGNGQARGNKNWTPGTPQQAAGTVPNIQTVVPGAAVFIILKDDQPTGQETAGIVAQVLTKGNHPRGIKVRLQDGQVGRVQRMGTVDSSQQDASSGYTGAASSSRPPRRDFSHKYTDVRLDEHEYPSELPTRSLADFMPAFRDPSPPPPQAATGPVIKCPFCDEFEGDEPAVTHHIDEAHLAG